MSTFQRIFRSIVQAPPVEEPERILQYKRDMKENRRSVETLHHAAKIATERLAEVTRAEREDYH